MDGSAWAPVAAGLVGGMTGIVGSLAIEWYKSRRSDKVHAARKRYLRMLLKHPKYPWRRLDTLSHIIGADEETTKRLLIEIDARASENGEPLWALVSRQPFPDEP